MLRRLALLTLFPLALGSLASGCGTDSFRQLSVRGWIAEPSDLEEATCDDFCGSVLGWTQGLPTVGVRYQEALDHRGRVNSFAPHSGLADQNLYFLEGRSADVFAFTDWARADHEFSITVSCVCGF